MIDHTKNISPLAFAISSAILEKILGSKKYDSLDAKTVSKKYPTGQFEGTEFEENLRKFRIGTISTPKQTALVLLEKDTVLMAAPRKANGSQLPPLYSDFTYAVNSFKKKLAE